MTTPNPDRVWRISVDLPADYARFDHNDASFSLSMAIADAVNQWEREHAPGGSGRGPVTGSLVTLDPPAVATPDTREAAAELAEISAALLSHANISDRPGQYNELTSLAARVAKIAASLPAVATDEAAVKRAADALNDCWPHMLNDGLQTEVARAALRAAKEAQS